MKKEYILILLLAITAFMSIAFTNISSSEVYVVNYHENLGQFRDKQLLLLETIKKTDFNSAPSIEKIKSGISEARNEMKGMDFWFRYLEPISYKKINGPLPVEWETEVFEKFEKPYKRDGAGLTLAVLYLEEEEINKDTLLALIEASVEATRIFSEDSITGHLKTHHHFFLCNRLFLLNLAAIYTTGFECPVPERIIPEMRVMLSDVGTVYENFNRSFPGTPVSEKYLALYKNAQQFVAAQPSDASEFDHYTFIREYVNPLFAMNQGFIMQYQVVSKSYVDYSLSKKATSIFNKSLYYGQNSKGIFHRVKDEQVLAEIDRIGKLLFYDPVLSGNNLRSCASCHKPTEYFTDTIEASSLHFNRKDRLPRNTPSLINVEYNHLIMLDGKHISLQDQTREVISSKDEMGSIETEMVKKVLSCQEYNKAFKNFLNYTPQEKEITYEHIASAITLYYSKFGKAYAPFDEAMNKQADADPLVKNGFNIFMSKAQCATCHFVPQFNGVKPPYVNSEFEVLGTPGDGSFKGLSADLGRFGLNPAFETKNAFRTGSLRNIEHTKPYMHNGVFRDLDQVIEFYNNGGGAGRGIHVENQTLSADSLHLTAEDKKALIAFMKSLNERVPFEKPPVSLPVSKNKKLNTRKVGGEY